MNNGCEATGKTSNGNEQTASNDTTNGKIVGIYGLQNKLKPEKWYVGQSNDIADRWHKAYTLLHCKKQRKIYSALKKYGSERFRKVVLEECLEQHLNDRETYWIHFYNSVENGYNLTYGGEGGHVSEETKRLLSKKLLGRTLTDEHRRKIGLRSRGRKWTDVQREKRRNSTVTILTSEQRKSISESLKKRYMNKENHPNFGKPCSLELREKIRLATTGKKRSLEACRNIALANTGRKFSDAARERMKLAQQLRRQTEKSLPLSMPIGISSDPITTASDETKCSPSAPNVV